MTDPPPSVRSTPARRALPAPSEEALREALARAFSGTAAGPSLLDLYARHARLLLEENRRVNLTAVLDPDDLASKHYFDSFVVSEFVSFAGRRTLDVGTGGGFPGIPLAAVVPAGQFVLLDGTAKKVDFVARAIEALGLRNSRARWGRAEEVLRREPFDLLLARAVGRLAPLLRLLHPVRRSFGSLVCMKGPGWTREAEEAAREGLLRSFPKEAAHEYALPGGAGRRVLLVLRGGR